MGCLGFGMFGIWNVQDVGCLGCGMFGMCDVRDVGCSGCGMFARMWDVCSDVGCWFTKCLNNLSNSDKRAIKYFQNVPTLL